ncbi:MAG: hypothetical protein F6J92_27900, partial [Symploca sp. SIO1A3]|nr:hypothetical protein [Symploca sp. SIO1A3]
MFYTDCLIKEYAAAADFTQVGSGLLALEISKIREHYILW